jgi:hypothetical protein
MRWHTPELLSGRRDVLLERDNPGVEHCQPLLEPWTRTRILRAELLGHRAAARGGILELAPQVFELDSKALNVLSRKLDGPVWRDAGDNRRVGRGGCSRWLLGLSHVKDYA